MTNGKIFAIVALLTLAILLIMEKVLKFGPPTKPVKRRKGVGDFGAYRSAHPTIPHQGQDYLAPPGADVFAPISGTVRIGQPYKNDARFSLVEISDGRQYKMKIMYVLPNVKTGDKVKRGDKIGEVQNLSIKYGASFLPQNHLHIEVRRLGALVNPTGYFPPDTVEVA